MTDIATSLADVRRRIATAAEEAGRPVDQVSLVAVSKTHDADAVRVALQAGQRIFGENRVQEAQGKFPDLKAEYPDLELHLIGPLQSNKVKQALALFDVIESLDRESLAEALAKELAKSDRKPKILVQVNTGEEDQKAGIPPREAEAFVKRAREVHGLPVVGLMCIPPVDEEPALHFALLREIAGRCGLDILSMGMSGDYEAGIRFGATHVRVGSAIFGARPPVIAPSDAG
ncbi:YggS family pyridoxal phosphate-dependent enzyme [Lacibacterium aquatile]|uniref:Pyridoxal phosphate homeostasis protein n=1 Tax=Lacibacterium aquatile TaxID=1168082 RepID=A0ABW5E025_9PROT